jgi:hypothetical protein
MRTLQRAADMLGSKARLARHLQVPLAALERWLAGLETPPHMYFLRAVDIVLNQDGIEPSVPDAASVPGEPAKSP